MNRDDCLALDAKDTLAPLRDEFDLPEKLIYLDGNSLGPLPHRVCARIEHLVKQEWGADLIKSWNQHDWINLPLTVGEKIAPLVGAAPGQVLCADSTSINLFKVLASACSLSNDRTVILSSDDNFPTDLYMAQGLAELSGKFELKLVRRDELPGALDDSVAVLLLTEVDFRSGLRFDMQSITKAAHDVGSLVVWDLSHSTGAIPVQLDQCDVDFAVGCGYKFLNGGPGAPAYLYVAERHQRNVNQPLSGWMGHARPFDFVSTYEPRAGIARFASGTPGILGLSSLDAALDLWHNIDVESVQAKSVSLANVVKDFLGNDPAFSAMAMIGPGPGHQGGSQVSLRHKHAYAIVQALIEVDVIGDFREPDIVRLGLCPLYLSHLDVFDAMQRLREVLTSEIYLEPGFSERQFVT